MKRTIPIVTALVLIAITGVIQGRWSERWAHFPELDLFAKQLPNVPTRIGDWTGVPREEPTKRILDVAGAVGSLSRDYSNSRGDTVSVFLVCGRVQDMFAHEPKTCYTSAGFELQNEPEMQTIKLDDGGTADFFFGRFTKNMGHAAGHADQMIYWSWCGAGEWIAPSEPKWAVSGQRAIYKLYVVCSPTRESTPEENAAADFIPELIPVLNKAFAEAFAASPVSQASEPTAQVSE